MASAAKDLADGISKTYSYVIDEFGLPEAEPREVPNL